MRQQRKPGTRKQRLREKRQAKRWAEPFIGTCSNCRDKGVKVQRFKSSQVCVAKCLGTAISRLGGASTTPAEQAIKAA